MKDKEDCRVYYNNCRFGNAASIKLWSYTVLGRKKRGEIRWNSPGMLRVDALLDYGQQACYTECSECFLAWVICLCGFMGSNLCTGTPSAEKWNEPMAFWTFWHASWVWLSAAPCGIFLLGVFLVVVLCSCGNVVLLLSRISLIYHTIYHRRLASMTGKNLLFRVDEIGKMMKQIEKATLKSFKTKSCLPQPEVDHKQPVTSCCTLRLEPKSATRSVQYQSRHL